MSRLNRLKTESKKSNEILDNANDSKKLNNPDCTSRETEKIIKKGEEVNEQIAEEKEAAKIVPLNLISKRFKNADSDTLKGKF